MPSSGVELVDVAFGILGPTALRLGNRLQENWGRPKEQAILATLLVHPGRTVSFGALIEWAWPGESVPPRDPASTLYTHTARLRKSLELLSPVPLLSAGNGGYRLDVDRSLIDYHQFRALIAQARDLVRQNDHQLAAETAGQAISLWRGEPLEDIQSESAAAWRARIIQDEWLPAQITLLEALVASQQFDSALVRLNELQAEHPLDVNLVKLRMSVLHQVSRSAEGTAYYLNMWRRLRDDADDLALDHLRRHHEQLTRTPNQDSHPGTRPQLTPHQVPQGVSRFIGRTDTLAALDSAIGDPQTSQVPGGIVIVHGMPGVGKTSVVVHWAHRVKEHFPDGDFYVDLHGFSRSPAIPHTTVIDDFLIALGHPPDRTQRAREKELALSHLFTGKRALVILDNAKDTAQVERLIPLLTSCLIIVTSRQRMTVLSRATGARQISVDPMSSTEGAELLASRLDRDRVTADTGIRISALCNGLPLAIAILGHHIASRPAPAHDFIQRLTTQALITDIGEDGDEAINIRTVFDWSYHSLSAPERRLFRLLGLHPGSDISVEAACAYDGRSPAETRRSLGALVGMHLIEQPRAFDRYQCHDLIREYAADCAHLHETPTERSAADLRMVEYYLAAANQAYKTLYPGHMTAPELPSGNDFGRITYRDTDHAKSWFDQERTTLSAVIRYSAERGNHAHAWRLADPVAVVFDRYGYYTDSRTMLEVAVSSAASAEEPEAEASCRAGLGLALMILGEHAKARESFDLALRFAEKTNSERGQGSALHLLGRLEMLCGNLPAAVPLLRRCLQIMQNTDDHEALAWAHSRLGEALRRLDQYDEALLHLHQAQFHALRIDDTSAHASALSEIASVFRDRDDHENAATYCRQALTIVDSAPIRDLAITIHVCQALAEIVDKLGQIDEAYQYARRAVDISQSSHNVTAEARSWDVLGGLYFARGDLQDAAVAWQQASELYDRIGNYRRSTAIRIDLRRIQAGNDGVPGARTSSPNPHMTRTDATD
jgi:tetratricopeptide (TPR) repeat protein/DNA-binding SARP family transcriptional activator